MMPNADAIALGKQIKAVRKAMKMTQEQLALKSNVSVKYIANIENGKQNGTLKNDIKKIADTYNAYVSGTLENVKGFCAVATTEEIAKQDYILTPGRYVGIEEQQDDGEPFEEKMARLTSELSDLFVQSHKLEAEIKEKLGAIGYEI